MANVFDVASYVLHQTGRISTWKLQKLCYYSQAWSLAWTGEPLFDEDFQAWRNGPVCPALFAQHRGRFTVTVEELGKGNADALSEDQKDTVDTVLKTYGDWEPYKLREQTHSEMPWRDARRGYGSMDICHNIITKDAMGQYYGEL